MMGIKDSIPYKEVGLNIRSIRDQITEWIIIQTHKGKKIRITNIYLPSYRKKRRRGVDGAARSSNLNSSAGEESEDESEGLVE